MARSGIWARRNCADEDSSLLGCYANATGYYLLTFPTKVVHQFSRSSSPRGVTRIDSLMTISSKQEYSVLLGYEALSLVSGSIILMKMFLRNVGNQWQRTKRRFPENPNPPKQHREYWNHNLKKSEFRVLNCWKSLRWAYINLTTTKSGRLNEANSLTLRTISELRVSVPDEGSQYAIFCLSTKEDKQTHKSVRLLQKHLMPHVNLSLGLRTERCQHWEMIGPVSKHETLEIYHLHLIDAFNCARI